MDILSDKKVKTRKKHHCFMCCRNFDKGTIMQRQVNTYDEIGAVYTCLACNELQDYIEPEDHMWWEEDTLNAMDGDDFKGTPEEYLEFKKSQQK